MKNFYFASITIVLLLILYDCQNSTDPNIKEETQNVSINGGEVFKYQTGISGDEEVATIAHQPRNYEVSTIIRDSTTNWEAVYQYKPESGFQGTNHVELKLGTNSYGSSPNKNITLVTLNITVN